MEHGNFFNLKTYWIPCVSKRVSVHVPILDYGDACSLCKPYFLTPHRMRCLVLFRVLHPAGLPIQLHMGHHHILSNATSEG